MPPPTREQVNALIERRKPLGFFTVPDCLEAVAMLTALQAENDRLRAQASPAWVAIEERKPTREDGDANGHVLQFCNEAMYKGWITSATWDALAFCTHWMRLPSPPHAPESAADRQRREDEEAFKAWEETFDGGKARMRSSQQEGMRLGFIAGIAHARKEATP